MYLLTSIVAGKHLAQPSENSLAQNVKFIKHSLIIYLGLCHRKVNHVMILGLWEYQMYTELLVVCFQPLP
jgi:hypothetical protein